MNLKSLLISTAAATALAMTATGCGSDDDKKTTPLPSTKPADDKLGNDIPAEKPADTTPTNSVTPDGATLSGDIISNTILTKDKVWILDGLVAIKNGAVLTIEAGTTVAGKNGTGAATSYLVVDKGAKIIAEGTAAEPIIFTSKDAVDGIAPAVGQWGGVTIIGNAANDQVNPYEVTDLTQQGTKIA
jgi:hypothetical protein